MNYSATTLVAFIDAKSVTDPETKQRWINGVLVGDKDIRTLYRWRTVSKVVDIGTADEFLMRHDLMTWEFEMWADEVERPIFRRRPPARRRRPSSGRRSRPTAGLAE